MAQAESGRYFVQKADILKKMIANMEAQRRLIRKREMKGLKRLLREQDGFLNELMAVNLDLAASECGEQRNELRAEIAAQQKDFLRLVQQAVQDAGHEKNHIAAEMRSKRLQQQVQNQYLTPWVMLAKGRRINEKG